MNKPGPLYNSKHVAAPPAPKPSTKLPGIDNDKVISSFPNLIKENSTRIRSFDQYGKDGDGKYFFRPALPRDNKGCFAKSKAKRHRIAMMALFWTTIGFICGTIFEMFVQLITR